MAIWKDGQQLLTLEDWAKHAGPKSADQWQDGRSAKESARFWLAAKSPSLPVDVSAILESHPAFGPPTDWKAEPEVRMHFDDLPGEPRNADLLVSARDRYGDYLIAVEAKADESFGPTIGEALAAAVDRKLENPRSNGVTRIESLVASLLGSRRPGEPALANLRYQLFTAVAGALHAAARREDDRVLVLVQEFVTDRTTDEKRAQNARDLRDFARRLSHGGVSEVEDGGIYGPFAVAEPPLSVQRAPSVYIGKIRCDVRSARGRG